MTTNYNTTKDELEQEEWRDIPDFPGYQVSNMGRVRSFWRKGMYHCITDKPKILKFIIHKTARFRPCVTLVKDGKHITKRVHRLVLSVFVGPRPEGKQCCHWDGDVSNNRLDNLRWGTGKENQGDSIRHGTRPFGERIKTSKLTEKQVLQIREKLSNGECGTEIAKQFGISQSNVSSINVRKIWRHLL